MIAFDAANSDVSNSGSTLTIAQTCTGSNRLLFAGFWTTGTSIPTDVAYNGTEMTKITNSDTGFATPVHLYLYYLVAPTSGTHNLVVTQTGSSFLYGSTASYTGVSQLNPVEVAKNATGGTALTTSLTTIADNCWVVGFAAFQSSTNTFTGSNGTTVRSFESSVWNGICDNNAAITPAGSASLTANRGNAGSIGIVMASIKPALTTVGGRFTGSRNSAGTRTQASSRTAS